MLPRINEDVNEEWVARQDALPCRWPGPQAARPAVGAREAASCARRAGTRRSALSPSAARRPGAKRRGGRRRPARRRDDVRGQGAARRRWARRLLEGRQTGLDYDVSQPGGGEVQLHHRRHRECRRDPAGRHQSRWEAPLVNTRAAQGGAARAPRCSPSARRRPDIQVEWLGDDLALLGKLPQAVAEAFAKAERPAVIVGAGALGAGALGAALALVEPLKLVARRLERLQRAAYRRARMGGADARLRAEGRHGRYRGGQARSWCLLLGADEVDFGRASRARSRSISATMATRARMRPTSSCRARPTPRSTAPTSISKAGCSSATSGVPPGRRARGLDDPARAVGCCSAAVPFDSFDQLRAAMVAEVPRLARGA